VLTNESMYVSWFIQHKSDFTSKWEFYQQTWWYGLLLILDTNRQTKSDPLEYGQKGRNQTIQPKFFFFTQSEQEDSTIGPNQIVIG